MSDYETYLFAKQKAKPPYMRKLLLFRCTAQARVQADPARGLSCAGTTPEAIAGPISYTVELFATRGASISLDNGWRIVGYETANGKFTEKHQISLYQRRDMLLWYRFKVPGQGTAFKHVLLSFTFSKPGGVCPDVLAEAFPPIPYK